MINSRGRSRAVAAAPATAPVIVSPVVMLADENKPAAPHPPSLRFGETGRRHVMNVCANHGMHKVAICGGKSYEGGR